MADVAKTSRCSTWLELKERWPALTNQLALCDRAYADQMETYPGDGLPGIYRAPDEAPAARELALADPSRWPARMLEPHPKKQNYPSKAP